MRPCTRGLILTALLSGASATQAHHSYAMFDATRAETIHGRVRAVEWTNPHVWIWVDQDVTAQAPIAWGFETVSPGELIRFFGWSSSSLKIGEEITVVYAPLRSGRKGGALQGITLSDGRVLKTPAFRIPSALKPPGASKP